MINLKIMNDYKHIVSNTLKETLDSKMKIQWNNVTYNTKNIEFLQLIMERPDDLIFEMFDIYEQIIAGKDLYRRYKSGEDVAKVKIKSSTVKDTYKIYQLILRIMARITGQKLLSVKNSTKYNYYNSAINVINSFKQLVNTKDIGIIKKIILEKIDPDDTYKILLSVNLKPFITTIDSLVLEKFVHNINPSKVNVDSNGNGLLFN